MIQDKSLDSFFTTLEWLHQKYGISDDLGSDEKRLSKDAVTLARIAVMCSATIGNYMVYGCGRVIYPTTSLNIGDKTLLAIITAPTAAAGLPRMKLNGQPKNINATMLVVAILLAEVIIPKESNKPLLKTLWELFKSIASSGHIMEKTRKRTFMQFGFLTSRGEPKGALMELTNNQEYYIEILRESRGEEEGFSDLMEDVRTYQY